MTPAMIAAEIMKGGLDLAAAAPGLATRPLFIATAERDDADDQAVELKPALDRAGAKAVTVMNFQTDHGFNDQRLALTAAVLAWLAAVK